MLQYQISKTRLKALKQRKYRRFVAAFSSTAISLIEQRNLSLSSVEKNSIKRRQFNKENFLQTKKNTQYNFQTRPSLIQTAAATLVICVLRVDSSELLLMTAATATAMFERSPITRRLDGGKRAARVGDKTDDGGCARAHAREARARARTCRLPAK